MSCDLKLHAICIHHPKIETHHLAHCLMFCPVLLNYDGEMITQVDLSSISYMSVSSPFSVVSSCEGIWNHFIFAKRNCLSCHLFIWIWLKSTWTSMTLICLIHPLVLKKMYKNFPRLLLGSPLGPRNDPWVRAWVHTTPCPLSATHGHECEPLIQAHLSVRMFAHPRLYGLACNNQDK